MKNIYTSILLLITINTLFSQNVGINSTGAAPNTSAILDVSAIDKGLLIPRINLLTTTDIVTITTPLKSLLVYNTNITISGVGANGEGFYYYDGSKWIKLMTLSSSGNAWLTTGNSGTVDGTNFIGTTDNIPLNFRINNNPAGRIDSSNANVFLGSLSGGSITAQNNTAIGHSTLKFNSTGYQNTATGSNALYSNDVGRNNVSFGFNSLYNSNGSFNTAIGTEALFTNASGDFNVSIGYRSLYNNVFNDNNVAVGTYALYTNSSGYRNNALGSLALQKNTSGCCNNAFGFGSLNNNTTGTSNTAVGDGSLNANIDGDNNTALGVAALGKYNTTGTGNTALGFFSFKNVLSGNNITGIGAYSNAANGLTNATAIGAYSQVDQSNSIILGSIAGVNGATASTRVGIGTTVPASTLDVNGQVSIQQKNFGGNAGLLIKGGNPFSAYPNIGFSTVNNLGFDVIAANITGAIVNNTNGTEAIDLNFATSQTGPSGLKTRMTVSNNGNVGIGTTGPNAPLQFGNSLSNRIIVLFDYNNNDNQFFGFGINNNIMRYQLSGIAADHVFYAGTSSFASNELMRIKGNGNVGIGTPITNNKLTINNTATDPATTTSYPLAIQQAGSTDITLGSNSLALLQTWNSKPLLINGQGNNVGIGLNIAPSAKLDVNGALLVEGAQATHAQGAYLEWNKDNGGGKTYLLNQKSGAAGGFVIGEVDPANAITERLIIDNNGNVGIGTTGALLQKFVVNGNGVFIGTVAASCGLLTCSDIRYKKDIQPLQNTLSKVMQLKGVSYYFRKDEFKEKHFTNDKQIGLIAQEVEKIYPELVQTDEQGFKSIDYSKLTPILVEAIKELKEENDLLQNDNLQLKSSVQKLDTKVSDIEKLLQSVLPISQNTTK